VYPYLKVTPWWTVCLRNCSHIGKSVSDEWNLYVLSCCTWLQGALFVFEYCERKTRTQIQGTKQNLVLEYLCDRSIQVYTQMGRSKSIWMARERHALSYSEYMTNVSFCLFMVELKERMIHLAIVFRENSNHSMQLLLRWVEYNPHYLLISV